MTRIRLTRLTCPVAPVIGSGSWPGVWQATAPANRHTAARVQLAGAALSVISWSWRSQPRRSAGILTTV